MSLSFKKTDDIFKNHFCLVFAVVQYSMLRFQVKRKKLPGNLPELNDSQSQAVTTAINEPFTLIQGPPGKSNAGLTSDNYVQSLSSISLQELERQWLVCT